MESFQVASLAVTTSHEQLVVGPSVIEKVVEHVS
jgi:hypothetical protein